MAGTAGDDAGDALVDHLLVERGDTITLRITSSEPLKGKPVVTANQRGIAKYQVPPKKVARLSPTQYRVVVDTRQRSKPGMMKLRVVGTDKRGGNHAKLFLIRLQ